MDDIVDRMRERANAGGYYSKEWDEAADYIEKLKAENIEWQKFGNSTLEKMSDAVDDCVRATKLAKEKHEQAEQLREICDSQNKTMQKMWAQIDELAELAGVIVKPTRQ